MKKFTLLIMLLVTMVTTATAQLTEGAVYRIVNRQHRNALVFNGAKPSANELDETNNAQLWVLEAGSTDGAYYLRNLSSGIYLSYIYAWYKAWPMSGSPVDFFINQVATDGEVSYYAIPFDNGGTGAHYSNNQIVMWYTDAEASHWEFKKVAESQDAFLSANSLVLYTYNYQYGTTTIERETSLLAAGSAAPAIDVPGGFTSTVTENSENSTTLVIPCEIGSYTTLVEGTDFAQIWTNSPAVSPWDDDAYWFSPSGITNIITQGTVHVAYTPIKITESGEINVEFLYNQNNGENTSKRLDILGVDIINPADWSVVASDYHFGYAGGNKQNNEYSMKVEQGSYLMRYFVNDASGSCEIESTAGDITFGFSAWQTTLENLITEIEDEVIEYGTTPGKYTQASVEALEAALETANKVTDATKADFDALQAAYDNLQVCMPVEGKVYQLVPALFAGRTKAAYSTGSGLSWKNNEQYNFNFYWYIKPDGEGFAIQNIGTRKYASTTGWDERATESDEPLTITLDPLGEEQFNIIAGERLHCGGHSNGSGNSGNVLGWDGGLNSASSWYIVEADDACADWAICDAMNTAYNQLEVTGEEITLTTENVTCPQEHATVNSGATSDNGGVIAMLDNNSETYMHTAYNNVPAGPHYIQVDLGDGNTVTTFYIHTQNRRTGNVDRPKTWLVQGSNDGEAFTNIAILNSTADGAGEEFTSPAFRSPIAYRYLRFNVIDCYTSYRTYFHIAEFDLYKAIISDTEANNYITTALKGLEKTLVSGTNEEKYAAAEELNDLIIYSPAKEVLSTYENIVADNTLGKYSLTKYTALSNIVNATDKLGFTKAMVDAAVNELTASLYMPQAGKYYTIKGHISGNYLTAPAGTGKAMTFGAKVTANSIFYFDAEGHLLVYGSGFYINGKNHAYQGYKDTYAFMASKTGVLGTYAIDPGTINPWYDNGTALDVYSGANHANCNFIVEEVTTLPVTITDAKYATFYAPVAVSMPTGVTAHTVTINGDRATLSEAIETVPAEAGVILAGEAGEYNLNIITENVDAIEGALAGTVARTVITKADNTSYYVLGKDSEGNVGLYNPVNGTTTTQFINAGHKAYLVVEGANGAQFYGFGIGGETTAIEEVKTENGEVKTIYDLTGRRVEKITEAGIYIVNGKKILVK